MVIQPALCRTWSVTSKTGFLTTRLILSCYSVEGLLAIVITDRDGVPVLKGKVEFHFTVLQLMNSRVVLFVSTVIFNVVL